jgi:hypothetical protein
MEPALLEASPFASALGAVGLRRALVVFWLMDGLGFALALNRHNLIWKPCC